MSKLYVIKVSIPSMPNKAPWYMRAWEMGELNPTTRDIEDAKRFTEEEIKNIPNLHLALGNVVIKHELIEVEG